eukprot:scaffold148651_cov31-Tisochrysis_lutea.AAC.10
MRVFSRDRYERKTTSLKASARHFLAPVDHAVAGRLLLLPSFLKSDLSFFSRSSSISEYPTVSFSTNSLASASSKVRWRRSSSSQRFSAPSTIRRVSKSIFAAVFCDMVRAEKREASGASHPSKNSGSADALEVNPHCETIR